MVNGFDTRGWIRFDSDPVLAAWGEVARAAAREAINDPANEGWLQCEGTWFVGVDALKNDARGAVAGSGPLAGQAVTFLIDRYGPIPGLHRAQVSVTYPGYPRPREGETPNAFGYRLRRDAAHVDGILPEGPARRRFVREPHAWILGIPLSKASNDAAPLVVWEGSHRIMGAAFRAAFRGADDPQRIDVTEIYQAARKQVFETCSRVPLAVHPGEAVVLHRHCLHGVAPWAPGAKAGPDGRMMAYFRPEASGGMESWLSDG